MDPNDLELEEGPLSDTSNCQNTQNFTQEEDEIEGLPIEYLLGHGRLEHSQSGTDEQEENFQAQFYRLQIEETLFSSLDSNLEPPISNESASRLRLDIPSPAQSGRIVFSPGGSEAFVFPRQNSSEQSDRGDLRPEGERPTTVGQASPSQRGPSSRLNDDVPVSREEFLQENQVNPNDDLLASRRPQQQSQQRQPDFATSTGHDVTASSVSSSANPSPRRFRFPAGVRERFLLQDSDNYYNMHSVSEHELTGDAESAAETNSPLMTSRGGRMPMTPTADRATSPSMASVTSGHSAASSVGGPGGVRRNLEWDSGADLGYAGGLLAQRDAAASLSTLEKLAIGNYSNFFRTEPEGKSSRDRAAAARALPTLPRLLPGSDREAESRQMIMQKYYDSLLIHRPFHHPTNQARTTSGAGNTSVPYRDHESEPSKTQPAGRSKSDTTPEVSPSRRRSRRHRNRVAANNRDANRAMYGSPMRSSSLTDLSRLSGRRSSRNSNSDWFSRKPSPPTQHWSEPSSSSSTATVVPIQAQEQNEMEIANNILLRSINTDPRSLPPELQGMMSQDQIQHFSGFNVAVGGVDNIRNVPGRNSQTSLSSRQSASRSFETVIRVPDSDSLDTEDEIQSIRRSANLNRGEEERPANQQMLKQAWSGVRAKSLPKETSGDTELTNRSANVWLVHKSNDDYEEELRIRQYNAATNRQAWTTSNDETDSGFKRRREGGQPPGRDGSGGAASRSGRRSVGTHTARWAGRNRAAADRGSSMAATTSEDDMQHVDESARLRERRRPSFPTNTSTLESASHIDRAKSFEYFPGESFPLQENSSSYEYLPGHMVDDRPGTVASGGSAGTNKQQSLAGGSNVESNGAKRSTAMRNVGTSAAAYTSEYLTTEDTTSPRSSSSGTERRQTSKRPVPACNEPDGANYLDQLSRELRHKSKELHSAHLAQSKEFYRRLKKYIAFVSTPSLTPEDCRIKQEVAAQILSLVQNEESKLAANKIKVRPVMTIPDDISVNESVASESEPTTRQTGIGATTGAAAADTIDRTGGGVASAKPERRHQSSLSDLSVEISKAAVEPENNLSNGDIEVQKLRVEQMRRLRKELRKLEKLERLRLNKAVGGSPSVDAELMRQIQDAENSFDSVSTNTTDVSTKLISSSPTKIDDRLVVEGQSATSGSDTNRGGPKTSSSTQHTLAGAGTLSSRKSSSLRRGSRSSPQTSSTTASTKPMTSSVAFSTAFKPRIDKNKSSEKVSSDFGQTYPTPRSEKEHRGVLIEQPNGENNRSNKSVVTTREKEPTSEKSHKQRKPIAFYLPIGNQSPIIIGQRILREKNKEDFLGKENRNIFANYVAGLSSGVTKLNRKQPSPSPDAPKPDSGTRLSLQEALARNRPDFIARSSFRSQRLNEMRERRLEYEEQVRNWLANASSVDRTPPPVASSYVSAIPRLFDYRSMVSEARKKYLALPEVKGRQLEMQRRSNYRTNRLMASVFKKRLKNRVLKGQVSMSHRNGVI